MTYAILLALYLAGIATGAGAVWLWMRGALDRLEAEYTTLLTDHVALEREHKRWTDRDKRGRFKGGKP